MEVRDEANESDASLEEDARTYESAGGDGSLGGETEMVGCRSDGYGDEETKGEDSPSSPQSPGGYKFDHWVARREADSRPQPNFTAYDGSGRRYAERAFWVVPSRATQGCFDGTSI